MSDDLRAITITFELSESEEDEWGEILLDMFTPVIRRATDRDVDVHWSSRLVAFNECQVPLPGHLTNRAVGHSTITQDDHDTSDGEESAG